MTERSRAVAWIAALVVVALLLGTGGAIVLTQHLRDEGPIASSIYWKRRPGPRYRVCFLLTRSDDVKVAVVGPGHSGSGVRVLADGPLRGGSDPHCYDWDGRTASGQPVTPGAYHLQLSLRSADRVAVSGEHVVIHPPRAAS